jgi:hypothetical protein
VGAHEGGARLADVPRTHPFYNLFESVATNTIAGVVLH